MILKNFTFIFTQNPWFLLIHEFQAQIIENHQLLLIFNLIFLNRFLSDFNTCTINF